MGRRGLVLVAAALLTPLACVLALRWITSPVRREPPASAVQSRRAAAASDPNLPLFVGETRLLAARAIDDTAAGPLDQGLAALGRRWLGTPTRAPSPATASPQRLVLDLTAFDEISYVEQLLALINSRQVRTRTEGVDRFSDHVRRLRYASGRVDPCTRLTQPSLWALAAERRGYLVDLSRFMSGARQRRVPLNTLLDPALLAAAGPGRRGSCRLGRALEARVSLADLPIASVPAALPSLRSGDLFVLVRRSPFSAGGRLGLVDIENGRVGALWVEPGRGVVRSEDLLALLRSGSGTVGVTFLRPVPNADGRLAR